MINARRIQKLSLLILVVTSLSGCGGIPTRFKAAEPTFASTQGTELDVSDIVFEIKNRENQSFEPVLRGLAMHQRMLVEPKLAQLMQDDIRTFVNLNTHIDPTVSTTIRVTISKAQIVIYKYPLGPYGVLLPSRGIGAESSLQIVRLKEGKPAATCDFSDPVVRDDVSTLTSSSLRFSVEQLTTQYRQTLVDALEKRCASIFQDAHQEQAALNRRSGADQLD